MSTLTAQRSAVCKQILGDLEEAGQWPMPIPMASFNDDDVYVYDAATKQLIRHVPHSAQEVRDARYIGFRVMAGQAWAKGMAAKALGLWSKA